GVDVELGAPRTDVRELAGEWSVERRDRPRRASDHGLVGAVAVCGGVQAAEAEHILARADRARGAPGHVDPDREVKAALAARQNDVFGAADRTGVALADLIRREGCVQRRRLEVAADGE